MSAEGDLGVVKKKIEGIWKDSLPEDWPLEKEVSLTDDNIKDLLEVVALNNEHIKYFDDFVSSKDGTYHISFKQLWATTEQIYETKRRKVRETVSPRPNKDSPRQRDLSSSSLLPASPFDRSVVYNQILEKEREVEKTKLMNQLSVLENEIAERRSEISTVNNKILQRKELLDTIQKQIENKKKEFKEKAHLKQLIPKRYDSLTKEVGVCQAIARNYLSRRRLIKFDCNIVKEYLSGKEAKSGRLRNKALQEILTTEQSYIKSLITLWENYVMPLKEANILKDSEFDSLFSELELILHLNKILLKRLQDRLAQWPQVQLFGDIFKDSAPAMKLYYRYIKNFNRKNDLLNEFMKNTDFVAWNTKQEKILGGPLNSFMIMPVQRLPRYEMLLQNLISLTPKEHMDYLNLIQAKDAVVNVNKYINERQNTDIEKQQLVKILQEQRAKTAKKKESKKKDGMKKVSGLIMVTITSANILVPRDCFVRIIYSKQILETEVCKKTDKPKFEKDLVLELEKFGASSFLVQLFKSSKKSINKKTLIGEISFPVKEITSKNSITAEFAFPFSEKWVKKTGAQKGSINTKFSYHGVGEKQ